MNSFCFIPDGQDACSVTAWLQQTVTEKPQAPKPAIVICPGGGYQFVSLREGVPVAKKYFAAGYHTFILEYAVGEDAKAYKPLRQLAATGAQLRRNCSQWNIDPDRIAVCGFSAGGHLAASLGVLHNDPVFLEAYPQNEHIRPDAMILGYPVVTAGERTHKGTLRTISGNAPEGSEAYRYWGLDSHVDSQTPPTFLWHTAEDDGVPVDNSLQMALALSSAKVPYELHIFPNGPHGMSVCNKEVGLNNPYNARWVEWSIAWLNQIFHYEE